MSKLTKIEYQFFRINKLFEFSVLVVKAATVIMCVDIITNGISEVVAKSPEQINAFTILFREFISILKKHDWYLWMGWGCFAIAGISWKYERKRNKKLSKKHEQQNSINETIENEIPSGE